MPNLDGCSAAHFIRQNDSQTPIVAMTSNIRSDDIAAYYHHGMSIHGTILTSFANILPRNE